MLCCHILYLHIEEHFHPPHIQIFQHTSQWSFGQKSRRKSKSNIYSYCSKNSSTCYNLFFFLPQIATFRHFTYCQQSPVRKGHTYGSRTAFLYSLRLFRKISLHFCIRIMLILMWHIRLPLSFWYIYILNRISKILARFFDISQNPSVPLTSQKLR